VIDLLEQRLAQAKRDLVRLTAQLLAVGERRAAVVEASLWVSQVVEGMRAATQDRMATVVTRCLALVWDDDAYQFAIKVDDKGRAGFQLSRAGQVYSPDPDDDQVEGGVLDVAAFALRLSVVLASRKEKVLVLDEPFRFVSKEFRPAVSRLLEVLAAEFGVQIIQITHATELVSGDVVRIGGATRE